MTLDVNVPNNEKGSIKMDDENDRNIIKGKALERYFDLQNALFQFTELFAYDEKNDRAIAIIGASFLDLLLEHILIAFFIDDEKETNNLFQSDRPLGTYSSKISMAYCLGFLNEVVRDDLRLVGKVRNKFAHELNVSFADEQIRSWCSALKWHKQAYIADPPPNATTRDLYQVGLNILVQYLDGVVGIARSEKRRFRG